MMEIFEDHTVLKQDNKQFAMITKREHNPELSVMSNMVLDLVDFKDRVRPLSRDISMMEATNTHQKQNATELLAHKREFENMLSEMRQPAKSVETQGYSSGEIGEPQSEADAEAVTVEDVLTSSEDEQKPANDEHK